MFQTYSLTRAFDADDMRAQTCTVSDDDAINCAHMLAAGFNTMSRNFTNGFVLGVVDTTGGTVQYDGKTEQLKRDAAWFSEQTITFNPTAGDADTILTLFGSGETPTFQAAGKFSFAEEPKTARISRDVLEAAYTELEAVKEVLFDAGVETIPADRGVTDLRAVLRARDVQIDELQAENAELHKRDEFEHFARTRTERTHYEQNDATRTMMISYARGAYEKLHKIDPEGKHEDLQGRYRGTLATLAQYLVATGEADRDERHAAARRLVEKSED